MLRDYFFLTLSIFLFLSCHTFGQSEVDSLGEVLKDSYGLQRAELLLDLSSHTRQADIKKATNQASEALNIAERLGDEKLKIKSLSDLGFYHMIQEQDTMALESYLRALELAQEYEDPQTEASVLHQLGRF